MVHKEVMAVVQSSIFIVLGSHIVINLFLRDHGYKLENTLLLRVVIFYDSYSDMWRVYKN